MDTVYRVALKAVSIIRSRLFCASALAVISAVIIAFVSLNMNAVTVVAGDTSRVVLTLDDNPNRVLSNAGVELQEGDEIVTAGNLDRVEVNRAFDVQITADGISRIVRLTGGSVSDALEKVGVEVYPHDKLNVDLTQPVNDGMDINVDRIAYEEYTITQQEKYPSTIKYTNTIRKGRTIIKQAGKMGSKTLTYRKCFENGEVISNDLVNEVVNQKPIQEIRLVGTTRGTAISKAPFDIELNASGRPVNYSKVYTGRATAYSSDHGNAGTRTASGRRAQVGVVAVNPNLIPYGTKLYIAAPDGSYVYGYAVAGDTGLALMDGSALVDLFFDTYEECIYFGAKKMNVYVLG